MAEVRRLKAMSDGERGCPLGICDGSGWIDGPDSYAISCECREQRISRARSRGVSSVIPPKYRGVSFDRPPITELERTIVGVVREYVDGLEENLAAGRGLWLMGDVGTGKTSLAMLVSKTAIERGRSVAIYSLPRLLGRIRKTYDAETGEQSYDDFIDRLTTVDLLHVDDLGAEKSSDWVLEQLYAIVDSRYEQERPMVVTTNLDEPALREQIGARTVSRLVEICGDPLPLFGEDQRYRVA